MAPSSKGGIEPQFRLAPVAGYRLEFLGAELAWKFTVKYFHNRISNTLRSPQPQPGLRKAYRTGFIPQWRVKEYRDLITDA